MTKINVTKTFLPPIEEYVAYLQTIWDSGQLTNQGQILNEFEKSTQDYLGVSNLQLLTNGTVALQIAMRALDVIEGEIITTPFSYVATTSAILWEKCKPVFVDIEPETFCIDANKIEAAITPETKAILAVHVFGFPCDIELIESIANRYNLKVIYDGAHAFGAEYKNRSLLEYGDITTCSFHATKLFHTIEGGAVITKHTALAEKLDLIKRFGHNGDDHRMLGVNAKASEFQAAMGLCNLKYIDEIIQQRKVIHERYNELLDGIFKRPAINNTKHNYSYYPVLFESENDLLKALSLLEKNDIFPRRYFYPSLNTLAYLDSSSSCPISEDIASRILCLPLYAGLDIKVVDTVCALIKSMKDV